MTKWQSTKPTTDRQDLKWRSNNLPKPPTETTQEVPGDAGKKTKLKKVGSLWSRCDTNGAVFYSGRMGERGNQKPILIFENKFHSHDSSPDFIIYEIEEGGD